MVGSVPEVLCTHVVQRYTHLHIIHFLASSAARPFTHLVSVLLSWILFSMLQQISLRSVQYSGEEFIGKRGPFK